MGAGSLVAQDASVPASDAHPFLGEWSATLGGPQAPIDIRFDIVDDGGQVIGRVSGPGGSMILVEELSMSGSDLILSYRMDFGGQGFRVALSLTPKGEGLSVTLSGGGGAFTVAGTGIRR